MADEIINIRLKLTEAKETARDTRKVREEIDDLGDATERSGVKAKKSGQNYDLLGRTMRLVKPAALIAGLGLAAQGMAAAGAGAVALGGALAPLAGVMVAYPAAGAAAAQGMGAMRLAMLGVTDALGGLNEGMDVEKLSALTGPAQGFVKTLNTFKAPILGIQRAIQRGLFPGLETGLRVARPALGGMRGEMEATGAALGGIGTRVGAFVNAMYRSGDLSAIMGRNATYIGLAGDSAVNLANVLRNLLMAGAPLTMWLFRVVNGWTEALSVQAAVGRESGRLAGFFDRTRDALSMVFSISGAVAKALWRIASAGAPLGRDLLASINRNAEAFARWTGSAAGQNKIAAYFANARPAVYEIGKLIRDVVKGFAGLGSQPGLAAMLAMIRTELLPVLLRVTSSTTAAFGPHLIEMIGALAAAFEPLAGSSGPLVLYVQTLTSLARAAAWITTNVPGAAEALTLLVGATAVSKALGVASMASGLTSITRALTANRAAMITATGAQNASRLAAVRWRAATIGAMIAERARTAAVLIGKGATIAATFAQKALNLAMRMNPIMKIVFLVGALAAAVVAAYRKFPWFRAAVQAVWTWLKTATTNTVNWVKTAFSNLVGFLRGIPGRIKGAISGMWNGLKQGASDAVSWVANRFRDLLAFVRRIPSAIGGAVTGLAGGAMDAVRGAIPGLASGGIVTAPGQVWVGERGRELLTLPQGARVDPLPAAAGLASARVDPLPPAAPRMQRVDRQAPAEGWGGGGGVPVIENHIRTTLEVEGRVLAEVVEREVARVVRRRS